MKSYKILNKQIFSVDEFSIVPMRSEDRYDIMKWRNEQIYHLRQSRILTAEEQDAYFKNIVENLFEEEHPSQVLFSYLQKDQCIGYGGLVHINWENKNAEISFLMDTSLEKKSFELHWSNFLNLIEVVAFQELKFHKIYTFAYNIRPLLFTTLEKLSYFKEAILKEHILFNDKFIDAVFHSKFNSVITLRKAEEKDAETTYKWANDKTIRLFSFHKEFITWEDHKRWFNNKISSDSCVYYIFEVNGTEIGSIRFDIEAKEKALISYLIQPLFHGKGYGKAILEMGIEKLCNEKPEIDHLYGYVLSQNIASIKIFEKLHFQKFDDSSDQYRFEKFLR